MTNNFDKMVVSTEKTKKTLNPDDLHKDLVTSSLLAKADVPISHRRIAENFAIMRKICAFQIVQPRISNIEKSFLAKYNFDVLEASTISKVNSELLLLKQWALSTNDELRTDSVELLKIRIKELKFMLSDNYIFTSDEMFNGFKAIETYLISIPKYYSKSLI